MEQEILKTEVVIVGAGPAGAAASIFLSKQGIKHIVLEQATFPRDKVCGDAISGKATTVIQKMNPEYMHQLVADTEGFEPFNAIDFVAPNGKHLHIPIQLAPDYPYGAKGVVAPRLHFDNFLFEKIDTATASIYQGVRNLLITRNSQGIHVAWDGASGPMQLEARIVLGADGDKSAVAKALHGKTGEQKSHSIGLRAYYKNVGALAESDALELHFIKDVMPGYLWIFPMSNGMANVGVGMLSADVRHKKINLRQRMLDAISAHPALSKRFEGAELQGKIVGWGLPMATTPKPISGDNYLLLGDAAALIDPFTGEGIGNALYSGMRAADACVAALENRDYSAVFLKEKYDRIIYRYIGDEVRISLLLQRLCRYPWLFNVLINKAIKSHSLQQTIQNMFADMDLREQLRNPLFYLKIFLNK